MIQLNDQELDQTLLILTLNSYVGGVILHHLGLHFCLKNIWFVKEIECKAKSRIEKYWLMVTFPLVNLTLGQALK